MAIPASAFTSSLFISSIPSGRIILILLVYSDLQSHSGLLQICTKNATSLHPASSSLPLISISQSNFTGGSGVNTDSSFIFSPLLNAVALSSPFFSNSSILNVNGGCFRFVEFLSLSGFCLPYESSVEAQLYLFSITVNLNVCRGSSCPNMMLF